MKLIIGLGNPGRSYAKHRHNIGFWVIDRLAAEHDLSLAKKMFSAKIAKGEVAGAEVVLAKPQTFMNRSGWAVAALSGYYKCSLKDLIVIHDDIDLELGRLKFSAQAGHGGHNGIKSIIEELGSTDFMRVRLGVGRPPELMDPADYVLQAFRKEEEEAAQKMTEQAVAAVEDLLKNNLAFVQQKYH